MEFFFNHPDCQEIFEYVFGSFTTIQEHEIPARVHAIMNDRTKSRELKYAASKFLQDQENGICHPFIPEILRNIKLQIQTGQKRFYMEDEKPLNQTGYEGPPDLAPPTHRPVASLSPLFSDDESSEPSAYHYFDSDNESVESVDHDMDTSGMTQIIDSD